MYQLCKLANSTSLLQVYLQKEGSTSSNSYLIVCGELAYVIDPSCEPHVWGEYADKVKLLFATHGHYDHITACDIWRTTYPSLELCVEVDEAQHMQAAATNVSWLFGKEVNFNAPNRLLQPNERIQLADGVQLKALHTPGHTPGSTCYLLSTQAEGALCLFTGDTLFAGSIGRVDFPGGNAAMMKSTMDYMCSLAAEEHLPQNLPVFPGHGVSTSLDFECANNLFLTGVLHI